MRHFSGLSWSCGDQSDRGRDDGTPLPSLCMYPQIWATSQHNRYLSTHRRRYQALAFTPPRICPTIMYPNKIHRLKPRPGAALLARRKENRPLNSKLPILDASDRLCFVQYAKKRRPEGSYGGGGGGGYGGGGGGRYGGRDDRRDDYRRSSRHSRSRSRSRCVTIFVDNSTSDWHRVLSWSIRCCGSLFPSSGCRLPS